MMRVVSSLVLALGTYLLTSLLLYGSPITPIWFATAGAGHLGAPFWMGIAAMAVGLSACLTFVAWKGHVDPTLLPALFVAGSLTLCTLAVGAYAQLLRAIEVRRFAADEVTTEPFVASLREVPRDFQLFLHAAALKNCAPYAWSYREMAFYRLPPDAAVNVLPPGWVERCGIRRTERR